MNKWVEFFTPYFPCESDADAFVKVSEEFGDPTAKVMMHQTVRLITLANSMQALDDARDPLSLFFIIVCAECVAKLHADYKKDNKSHEFVTKFFDDHVLPEDNQKMTQAFTRTALDNLAYHEIVDLLYVIRCDVAHEGRYWGFSFPDELQPRPIINPHPKAKKKLSAEKHAAEKRNPVIVKIRLEEIRDIVVRGCIKAVQKRVAKPTSN